MTKNRSQAAKPRQTPPARWGNPAGDPEELDTTPVEMPVGYNHPRPLQDLIATMVRQAVQDEQNDSFGTMEDEDDFEEETDELLDFSEYELTDIQAEEPLLNPDDEPPDEPVSDGGSTTPPTGDPPNPNEEEPETP